MQNLMLALWIALVSMSSFIRIGAFAPRVAPDAPEDRQYTRQIFLGYAGGARLSALLYTHGGGPGEFRLVAAKFLRMTNGKKTVVTQRELGVGDWPSAKVVVADVVHHRGRKQLFVSLKMGGVSAVLYDFDGTKLRKCYDGPAGRVGVDLVKGRGSHWTIVEAWNRIVFEDEEDMGEGYAQLNGAIVRRLYWNGKAFVPIRPGLTRIHGRKLGHSHSKSSKKAS